MHYIWKTLFKGTWFRFEIIKMFLILWVKWITCAFLNDRENVISEIKW